MCRLDECDKTPQPGYRDGVCQMHRRRMARHGTYYPEPKQTGRTTIHGYVALHDSTHPLAWANGYVLEHRRILYARLGPGAHQCHWCGKTVAWETPFPDGLVGDHLDRERSNNDPNNLVASCLHCNVQRQRRELTHCKHGHEFTAENTQIRPNGNRSCRACGRIRSAKYARKSRG